ncbi:MAG: crosslink repair DNA glycosylase YcaQ family protein [Acidobacteriota bacterium]
MSEEQSEKLRAWWSHRQGLDGSLAGKPSAEVFAQVGWARSVGGVGPYLTLFARNGANREDVDASVARLEIHELPSARGCTYVLPASDFTLALQVNQGSADEAQMRTARKLGVTDQEIAKLRTGILKALGKGALDPEELRRATGDSARSLGEEGKKKGLTTTLPLALGQLQTAGDIRRVPVNGRLDQQRYRYILWRPNPLAGSKWEVGDLYSELARRFFRWIGPATIAEFQWFSGLGVKASKAAVDPLNLVAFEPGSDRLIFPEDKQKFEEFRSPKEAQYSLVSSVDSIFLLRRNVQDLLAAEDFKQKAFDEKGVRDTGNLMDLPNHAILDRGRLIGLWEYDQSTESIAWTSFGVKDKKLEAAVKRTESYVREQLGDARSFSLDSPKSRAPKIEALRAAG